MTLLALLTKRVPTPVTILAGPFRGARLILNPAHSKRKILGAYEHVLNPWLRATLKRVDVVWDVGANDGYFTYGCAAAILAQGRQPHVVAFEPGLDDDALLEQQLTAPARAWVKAYAGATFEFIPAYVGANTDTRAVALDVAAADRPALAGRPALVKVDVEGSEVDVLDGATQLLRAPTQWLVEVHGDHLLEPVVSRFQAAQRLVDIHRLKPHWLFGPEARAIPTCWVTTRVEL
ncbi:MAG: FkbM family methyltransferase [Chloracidobacterium sp.]|uniref:FkbM family methyltransferase n=1 Tax=Chloracidobacterium validum TaxID=2821543 RepID=A0ABX8BG50_9BACT|nr:FkbM family methyltransferase [Chloracidobacterium validum]QUW04634.1 FkbM family methyltransferase [Chloracidobacterium validum]